MFCVSIKFSLAEEVNWFSYVLYFKFLSKKRTMERIKFWRCKDFDILLQRNKKENFFNARRHKFTVHLWTHIDPACLIFCEFLQIQMYATFENAHRSQFTGRSVKACRSKFNTPCDCYQTQISEEFWIKTKPNSRHICERQQIQLHGNFCKYLQNNI